MPHSNLRLLSLSLHLSLNLIQASKISKEYESRGGDYENEAGSKNEPAKGAPKAKTDDKKATETKATAPAEKKDDKAKSAKEDPKPKANSGKKAEPKAKAPKKEKKPPAEGTRKSSRVAASGQKRSAPEAKEAGGSKKAKK